MLDSFFCWVNFLLIEYCVFDVFWCGGDMCVVILGSGVVGVVSVWYLVKDGYDVMVIDW